MNATAVQQNQAAAAAQCVQAAQSGGDGRCRDAAADLGRGQDYGADGCVPLEAACIIWPMVIHEETQSIS